MRYGRLNGDSRPIPYTFGRYTAQTTGSIYDELDKVLIYPDTSGLVRLRMDEGLIVEKPILWFILLAFKPINLPIKKALAFDYQIHSKYPKHMLSKYTWFLKEPLSSDHYDDFYHIPGYSRYLINKDGVVLTTYGNGKSIIPLVNVRDDLYQNVYMMDDYGKGGREGIHRLLCGTFKSTPPNAPELVVNHMDLVKLNNHLSNLEWCTEQENLAHAQLLYGKNTAALSITITDGSSVNTYVDIHLAAKVHNVSAIDIWKIYRGHITSPLQVKITKSNGESIDGLLKLPKTIESMDIHSKEVMQFFDMGTCAKHFNVVKSNIHQAIANRYVLGGNFIFRYENMPWPEIPSDRRTSGPKDVLLFNTETREVECEFGSATKLIDYLSQQGIGTKKTIATALRDGVQRKFGKYIFQYKEDLTEWKY